MDTTDGAGPDAHRQPDIRLWFYYFDRLAVADRIAAVAELRVRRPGAILRTVRQRALVDLAQEPGHLRFPVHRLQHCDRPVPGHLAGPENPRRRRAARHLSVSDGAFLHRHRYRSEEHTSE